MNRLNHTVVLAAVMAVLAFAHEGWLVLPCAVLPVSQSMPTANDCGA